MHRSHNPHRTRTHSGAGESDERERRRATDSPKEKRHSDQLKARRKEETHRRHTDTSSSDSDDDRSDEAHREKDAAKRHRAEKKKKHKKHKRHKKAKKHRRQRNSSDDEPEADVERNEAVRPSRSGAAEEELPAARPSKRDTLPAPRPTKERKQYEKEVTSRWDSSGEGERAHHRELDSRHAKRSRTEYEPRERADADADADRRTGRDKSARERQKSPPPVPSSSSARHHGSTYRDRERPRDVAEPHDRQRPRSTNASAQDDRPRHPSNRNGSADGRAGRDAHSHSTQPRRDNRAHDEEPERRRPNHPVRAAEPDPPPERRPAGKEGRGRARNPEPTRHEWGKPVDEQEEEKPPVEKEKPNFGLSGKLTEEANKVNGVVIAYAEPPGARKPKRRWRLYPFKGDRALPTMYIHRQSCYLIGRDRKVCDLPVDHPSCSKQHAVLQYRLVPYERNDGSTGQRVRPYVIDLQSANGTFVNNSKIEPKRYLELREKDVLKFGFSSREYVLLHENSKEDNEDDEGYDVSPAPSGGVKKEPQEG
uniref:FHA domain-containing protein n=1 Tax=Anopheles dirus TaxID=7168 RepID=A0A182N0H1_9DIPT